MVNTRNIHIHHFGVIIYEVVNVKCKELLTIYVPILFLEDTNDYYEHFYDIY